jgi:hypothetical protein
VSSGSFGNTTSGVSGALGADFLLFGFVDLAVVSLADFGVDVPFGALGVVTNLMLVRGFLTESRCEVLATSASI